MATKDDGLSVKDKLPPPGDSIAQYNNFNLNQNYQCLQSDSVSVKSVPKNDRKNDGTIKAVTAALIKLQDQTDSYAYQSETKSDLLPWKETDKNDFTNSSLNLIPSNSEEAVKQSNRNFPLKRSTLSLHIVAYENSIEDLGGRGEIEHTKLKQVFIFTI
uniref:Uncharacterized protein n=1 Tax=Panagrolaimus sp. ES5 TaxID=591445 RepID=A0AC34GX13_9BILA